MFKDGFLERRSAVDSSARLVIMNLLGLLDSTYIRTFRHVVAAAAAAKSWLLDCASICMIVCLIAWPMAPG